MRTPRRGQIYRLKADEVGKPRRILIVSITELNAGFTCTAVPFTSAQLEKRRKLPTCVFFQAGECGLTVDCVAKGDDVTLIHFRDVRISEGPVGEVTDRMSEIEHAIAYAIGLQLATAK